MKFKWSYSVSVYINYNVIIIKSTSVLVNCNTGAVALVYITIIITCYNCKLQLPVTASRIDIKNIKAAVRPIANEFEEYVCTYIIYIIDINIDF